MLHLAFAGLLAVLAVRPIAAVPAAAAPIAAAANLAGTRDRGPAPAGLPVHLVVTLPYRNERELDALIAAQGDAGSPLFQRFLTPREFGAYFAPPEASYAAVAAALARAGFRVTLAANRTIVDADGTLALAARYFGTAFRMVEQPAGAGVHYANALPATLPAELRGRVRAIVGFDDLVKAQYAYRRAPRRAWAPERGGGQQHGPDGGIGPIVLQRAYDLPTQEGYDGSGHSVAIVAGNIKDSDLSAFLSYFGIRRKGATLRTIVQGVGGTSPQDPAVQEGTLDAETVASLAPGADIHLYIVENPIDAPGEDAYNTIVTNDSDDIVNSGFGVCETADHSYAAAILPIIKQGEALGISFDAATGNNGSDECSPKVWGENAPAVLPQVVAVGGTTLTVDARGEYVSEGGWSGSGGGVSLIYRRPLYQRHVKGLASTTHRNVPDLSFDADPYNGFSFYIGGAWAGPIGGTSWSTPVFSALQVEVNQRDNARGGFINARIYAAFANDAYAPFHDILTGTNGTYYCAAGYDNVTGIGSPRGVTFANDE
jgi:subtilase family serine protease